MIQSNGSESKWDIGIICMEDKGGMYHYFINFCTMLNDLGYDLYCIVLSDSETPIPSIERDNLHVKFVHIGRGVLKISKIFPRLVDKNVMNEISISGVNKWIIVWDSYFLGTIDYDNLQTALVVHDVEPHAATGFRKIANKILFVRSVKKRSKADFLITNSHYQHNVLSLNYPEKKVLYFHMPSTVTHEMINGDQTPSELVDASDYFLFFGRVEAYKGLDNLIKAFSSYSGNRKLVIAGKGNLPNSRELLDLVRGNKLIIVNRFIRDEEVRRLFEKACCVVFPYISATQVGPISIAYYFSKPVIVTGLYPFLENFNFKVPSGVVVSKNDVSSITYALEVMDRESSDVFFQENSRKSFMEYYGSDHLQEEILEALREFLGEGRNSTQ